MLKSYEKVFELCFDLDEMVMVFSKNTPNSTREELMVLWTNGMLQQYEKCVDLPPIIGKSKRKAFVEIRDKV